MAQQTLFPEEPRAAAARTSPPLSSAAPSSPTKSLWRRILNRGASTSSEPSAREIPAERSVTPPAAQLVSSPAAAPEHAPEPEQAPVSESALPSAALSGPSVPAKPASDGQRAGGSAHLPNASASGASGTNSDGMAAKLSGASRRAQRDVVPGLPRTQTLARQQSELRENLLQVKPTPAERRAASVDRRHMWSVSSPTSSQILSSPRTSAPSFSHAPRISAPDLKITGVDAAAAVVPPVPSVPSLRGARSAGELSASEPGRDGSAGPPAQSDNHDPAISAPAAAASGGHANSYFERRSLVEEMSGSVEESNHVDTASMTSSQYEQRIRYELEHIWILNLSMHFRDKSRREKFFVTYRQRPDLSRRVTISLDYRNATENSLEMDLFETKLQRDKNEMIYEAIRESLVDIQFYDTVTNLKLQTTSGRLHVHVVEDTTEIINYPPSQSVQHLSCRKIRERDVEFDSHMSGFVYKVRVNGRMLIKKEIPGPDSVDEFLYEVNALNFLRTSHNVIELYGVIIGDDDRVKGLLISYAEQGALIDIIYENNHGISWFTRVKWARQIVLGLSEIHEAGFVQGDFTLSNIVIDDGGNAKIIDINRRGCPVGWEPPEATPLIQSDQRISMYIGVKSDLYQLGMVLWALATQEDDPEAHGRPLRLERDVEVPQWYRTIVETCLAEDPRVRAQARQLFSYFPDLESEFDHSDDSDYDDDWVYGQQNPEFYAHSVPSGSVNDGNSSLRHRAGIESATVSDLNGDGVNEDRVSKNSDGYPGDSYEGLAPRIKTVTPRNDWSYVDFGHTYVDPPTGISHEPYYYPTRGRSPPSTSGRSGSRTRSVRPTSDLGLDRIPSGREEQTQRSTPEAGVIAAGETSNPAGMEGAGAVKQPVAEADAAADVAMRASAEKLPALREMDDGKRAKADATKEIIPSEARNGRSTEADMEPPVGRKVGPESPLGATELARVGVEDRSDGMSNGIAIGDLPAPGPEMLPQPHIEARLVGAPVSTSTDLIEDATKGSNSSTSPPGACYAINNGTYGVSLAPEDDKDGRNAINGRHSTADDGLNTTNTA